MKHDHIKLGNNLKNRRKEKKFTLLELEKISGLSKTTISRIENGLKIKNQSSLKKLCESLNTTTETELEKVKLN